MQLPSLPTSSTHNRIPSYTAYAHRARMLWVNTRRRLPFSIGRASFSPPVTVQLEGCPEARMEATVSRWIVGRTWRRRVHLRRRCAEAAQLVSRSIILPEHGQLGLTQSFQFGQSLFPEVPVELGHKGLRRAVADLPPYEFPGTVVTCCTWERELVSCTGIDRQNGRSDYRQSCTP